MSSVPSTNTANVGVSFALIVNVTSLVVGVVGLIQTDVAGSVSQRDAAMGKVAAPVSTLTIKVSLAPTFTLATAKKPVPIVFGMCTMPSLLTVAPKATISGMGVLEAESNNVFNPVTTLASLALAQLNCNCTSVGAKAAVGVKPKTKVWTAPAAMSTLASRVPVSALVVGLVV